MMVDLYAITYDNGYQGFAYAKTMSGIEVGEEVITEFDLGTKGRVMAVAKWVSDEDPLVQVIKSVRSVDRILKRIVEVEA